MFTRMKIIHFINIFKMINQYLGSMLKMIHPVWFYGYIQAFFTGK